MFIIAEYTLVRNEENGVFVKSSENVPGCPCCGGQLRYRDSRLRIRKHEGGDRDFLSIRRFRCTACESYHNELPDVLLPYKHYEAEVISGTIDGIVTPHDQDSEDYPSVNTMLYWLRWFQLNLSNMEGYLRNAGYSILGLGKDLLFSDQSLLEAVRKKYFNWLEKTIRIIYNSGGFLPAFTDTRMHLLSFVCHRLFIYSDLKRRSLYMNANQQIVRKWEEQEALRRFQLISPLLREDLDNAQKLHLRKKIAEENGITVRSLYRYEKAYREGQFSGLKPATRKKHCSQRLPENFGFLVEQAIQLRKEVPERSVAQIILILEMEGHVAPGVLKRPTLERHLYKRGFGREHMKMYRDARESSSKRFCKPHRMMLIQGDIKYGPKLPIGKNGAKVQTYLSSAIDDHSRYILSSRFYDNQEETIVEDTFHQAIIRYGSFDACYFDHGSQYVARQLSCSLARLGIRVKFARIRSGKSKGKIEKFHQVVDTFNREAKLKNIRSLEELNHLWSVFLEEYYHKKPHEGISEYYESLGAAVPENGITPLQEWNRDTRPLNFINASVVSEAFLHHEERKVDKGACISFRGQRYETKPELIGYKVEIAYDPAAPEVLTVTYPGYEPFTARPLKIGSYCDKNPTLPVSMQGQKPSTSRFLDALEIQHEKSREQVANAISFASYRKEADGNV